MNFFMLLVSRLLERLNNENKVPVTIQITGIRAKKKPTVCIGRIRANTSLRGVSKSFLRGPGGNQWRPDTLSWSSLLCRNFGLRYLKASKPRRLWRRIAGIDAVQ